MRTLAFAVSSTILLLPALALATTTGEHALPIANQIKKNDQQAKMPVKETNRLMGRLTLASEAIDLHMKTAALENLKQATEIAHSIITSRPEFVSVIDYNYGKTEYNIAGVERNYYLPVVDDVLVSGVFKEGAKSGKSPKVEEKGLEVVHLKLTLNLKDVLSALDATNTLVTADNFDEAAKSLGGVFKGGVTSEVIVTDPIWNVWANFVLAQDFLNDGQYKSVRFALTAAKDDLKKLEAAGTLRKNGPEAKVIAGDLAQIDKSLDERDPTTFQKVRNKVKGWAHKVTTWL